MAVFASSGRDQGCLHVAGLQRSQTQGLFADRQERDFVSPWVQPHMIQCGMGCQRGQSRLTRADGDSFAFEFFDPLDAQLRHHDVSDVILVAREHNQIAAGRDRVRNMGGADKSDLNLAGEHRLRRPAGDNEDRLDFHAVFAEKTLLARHPR